jgi:hypothetical protein
MFAAVGAARHRVRGAKEQVNTGCSKRIPAVMILQVEKLLSARHALTRSRPLGWPNSAT